MRHRLATWREQRRAWKAFERRAEQLCASLPFPPGRPFSVHRFVELVAEQRHLPIARPEPVPIEPGESCGYLVVTKTGIRILYDEATTRLLHCLTIFHQLAHLLLGHLDEPDTAPMAGQWFPNLKPKLVGEVLARGTVLTRGGFVDLRERQAERLARLMLQRALQDSATPPGRVAAARRWLAHYRTCRTLAPLWKAMKRAEPSVVLSANLLGSPWSVLLPQACRPADTAFFRIVEAIDARRKLAPWMDPAVATTARRLGHQAGLSADHLEAVVEAACLAAAARAKTRVAATARALGRQAGLAGDALEEVVEEACLTVARTSDATLAAPPGPTCAALDAHRDRARWLQVASVFTSAIVQATLAEQERRTRQNRSEPAAHLPVPARPLRP